MERRVIDDPAVLPQETVNWAVQLGGSEQTRMVIVHADDAGLTASTNVAVMRLMEQGYVSSTSIMVPCPAATEIVRWAVGRPNLCIGVHTTLTAEWPAMRWSPLSATAATPGLRSADGGFWSSVEQLVAHASIDEMLYETRTQVQHAVEAGVRVSHIDSHMGALYTSAAAVRRWGAMAQELGVALPLPQITQATLSLYEARMRWVSVELAQTLQSIQFPALSSYLSIPNAESYETLRRSLLEQIRRLPPGLHLLYLHPADDSPELRRVVSGWQKRVWEAQLMEDPLCREQLEQQDVVMISWRDVLRRNDGCSATDSRFA